MPTKTLPILCLLILVSIFYVSNGQTLNSRASNFELSNQFDILYKYAFPNRRKTILVFADRHSSKQTKEWTTRLRSDFKDEIQIVGIACMGWVPFFIKNSVKSSFTEKPSILLDWSNEVAERYDYAGGQGLLVYIDPLGTIKYNARGVFREDSYQELKRQLQK